MYLYNCYIWLALILFSIGAGGAIFRKNAIVIFLCIEIMLGGVNLLFLVFTRINQSVEGVFMVMCVMAVAAVEAAIGLAIFFLMYRKRGTIDVEKFSLLKR